MTTREQTSVFHRTGARRSRRGTPRRRGKAAVAMVVERPIAARVIRRRVAAEILVYLVLVLLAGWSAAAVKRAGSLVPLVQISAHRGVDAGPVRAGSLLVPAAQAESFSASLREIAADADRPAGTAIDSSGTEVKTEVGTAAAHAGPYFDGRPIRPAYTLRMRVTAYSPDHRSCAPFDDGMTATLHHVETNNSRLVAADTRLLPFGSIVSVPGYHGGEPVPVLDRGGAIKGRRLEVLYPTHERARAWGSRWLEVTVWEYADGGGRTDPRRVR